LSDLKTLRKEIDMLDESIVKLLRSRFEVVTKLMEIKKNEGLDEEDLDREKEILSKFDNECVKKIYGVMFKHAKNRTL